jgi:hypothetical protein
MVILDELHLKFGLVPEDARIPCFQGKAALVSEHTRLQEQNIRDFFADYLHSRDYQ